MSFKKVEDLEIGDMVDLSTCPYMKENPMAEFEYARVLYKEVEHYLHDENKIESVLICYDGLDNVSYQAGIELGFKEKPRNIARPR